MQWLARALWLVLPITSGAALDDALAGRSDAIAATAAILLWALWAAGVLALLAPRPWGFTVLRVATTVAVVSAAWSFTGTAAPLAGGALAVALAAAVTAMSAPVATACADGVAYGDERRFPLRAPFALLLGGLPLAALVVVAGTAAGPLLLAAGRVPAGIVALVVGLPLAAGSTRSLHALARRWLVLVPAGLVVVDPLTLVEPVRIDGGDVSEIRLAAPAPSPGALDLRLGTAPGSVLLRFRGSVPFVRRTARAAATSVEASDVLVTPLRAEAFAAAFGAARHRSGAA